MPWEIIVDECICYVWAFDVSFIGKGGVVVGFGWYVENGILVGFELGNDMFYVRIEVEVSEVIDGEQFLADRVIDVIKIGIQFGGFDGAHHKSWVIDQMIRKLAGRNYDQIVTDACADGADWDEGIAP